MALQPELGAGEVKKDQQSDKSSSYGYSDYSDENCATPEGKGEPPPKSSAQTKGSKAIVAPQPAPTSCRDASSRRDVQGELSNSAPVSGDLPMSTGLDRGEPPSKMARGERVPPPLTIDIVDASKLKTLTLWIALTRAQFESMMAGNEVLPDAYSGRFGLKRTMFKAVQRTKTFMGWQSKEEREYLAMRIEISPLGYMRKMEQGILVRCGPGEYRWVGGIYGQENDVEDGEWLYRIIGNAYHFGEPKDRFSS